MRTTEFKRPNWLAIFGAAIVITFLLAVCDGEPAYAAPFGPVQALTKPFVCKETLEAEVTGTLEKLPASSVREEITGWQLVTFMNAFNNQEPPTNLKVDKLTIIHSFVLADNLIGVFSIAGCVVDVYMISFSDYDKLSRAGRTPA